MGPQNQINKIKWYEYPGKLGHGPPLRAFMGPENQHAKKSMLSPDEELGRQRK